MIIYFTTSVKTINEQLKLSGETNLFNFSHSTVGGSYVFNSFGKAIDSINSFCEEPYYACMAEVKEEDILTIFNAAISASNFCIPITVLEKMLIDKNK